MALEEPKSTWDKRFKQKHYSYRDSERTTTTALPQAYVFGTNARAISIYNWPRAGDWLMARTCYAREVMVHCDQDVGVVFVSVNPLYLILLAQGFTVQQIAAGNLPGNPLNGTIVPATITERVQYVPANVPVTFYPTYGYAVTFFHLTAQGTIVIDIEGNVEGTE